MTLPVHEVKVGDVLEMFGPWLWRVVQIDVGSESRLMTGLRLRPYRLHLEQVGTGAVDHRHATYWAGTDYAEKVPFIREATVAETMAYGPLDPALNCTMRISELG